MHSYIEAGNDKNISSNNLQLSDGYSFKSLQGAKRIMSYNVENLFDTLDNPETADDDFTPNGVYHWNNSRYQTKLQHISKVIVSVGGDFAPILVGLCEIENEYVLRGLTQFSSLNKLHYKYIHKDSPDPRGIDVALLYIEEEFKPTKIDFINITLFYEKESKRRMNEIMYSKQTENLINVNLIILLNGFLFLWDI